MKRALCLLDGKEWEAQDFAAKPKAWRMRHRSHLICLGCGSRAFFRDTSRHGSRAFFGAKPHGWACPVVSYSYGVFRYLQ
ncbi:hypothetical protein SAMN04487914_11448 [Arthrobacter sp. ok909]|nr:hypothetical protein SAMN04487914_11448 [Arthrobacter sp. ok909]